MGYRTKWFPLLTRFQVNFLLNRQRSLKTRNPRTHLKLTKYLRAKLAQFVHFTVPTFDHLLALLGISNL